MWKRLSVCLLVSVLAATPWLLAADQTPKIPSKVVEKQVQKLTNGAGGTPGALT
jgi:hypothetical protein